MTLMELAAVWVVLVVEGASFRTSRGQKHELDPNAGVTPALRHTFACCKTSEDWKVGIPRAQR